MLCCIDYVTLSELLFILVALLLDFMAVLLGQQGRVIVKVLACEMILSSILAYHSCSMNKLICLKVAQELPF